MKVCPNAQGEPMYNLVWKIEEIFTIMCSKY